MEPGAGEAAAAAARAFAHRRGGQQAAQEQTAPARSRGSRARRSQPLRGGSRPAAPGRVLSSRGVAFEVRRSERATTPTLPVDSRAPQPRADVILAKPSTLIETPLAWDGAGPLPGESISRYREPAEETPAPVHNEPFAPAGVEEETAYAEEIAVSDGEFGAACHRGRGRRSSHAP